MLTHTHTVYYNDIISEYNHTICMWSCSASDRANRQNPRSFISFATVGSQHRRVGNLRTATNGEPTR